MATVAEALALALQHHQAGQLQQAETIYRQILEADPGNADAMHLLGVIAHQVGQHDLAIQYINEAIRIQPFQAAYHSNLGTVYQALGRQAEAGLHYQEAVRSSPIVPSRKVISATPCRR